MSDVDEVVAQVAEAAPEAEFTELMVGGETYQVPAHPTIAYLEAVGDLTLAEQEDDDGGKLRATIGVVKALLGPAAYRRVRNRDARLMSAIFDAAHGLYGEGVDQGNSDSSPTS